MSIHNSSPSVQDQFAFQSISKKSKKSYTNSTVLDIMESCGMVDIKEVREVDFAHHPDTNKNFKVLEFNLAGNAASLKGLFNGMICLGNPKEVSLNFQKDLDSYVFKYYESDEKVAVKYFEKIVNIIEDEIRFKSILRKVIDNLKAFDTSQQLLRNELYH